MTKSQSKQRFEGRRAAFDVLPSRREPWRIDRTPGDVIRLAHLSKYGWNFTYTLVAQDGQTFAATTLAGIEQLANDLGVDARPTWHAAPVVRKVDPQLTKETHEMPNKVLTETDAKRLLDKYVPFTDEQVDAFHAQARQSKDGRLARYKAATAESMIRKAAALLKVEAPATPLLDSMNTDYTEGKKMTTTKTRKTREPKAVPEGLVITKNGEPLARNSLSFAAWAATKGISRTSPDRIGVAELKKVLHKLGVEDPENSMWDVTLPNGVQLRRFVNGKASPSKKATTSKAAPKSTRKAAAPKAKATAAKSTKPSTRKAPARKAS